MTTSSMVYWITRLDGLVGISIAIAVFGVVGSIPAIIWICESGKFRIVAIIPILIFVMGALMSVLIPTTKEMCAILILPKIANSQVVQELPSDMLDLKHMAMDYLKEKMEEKKK